MSAVSKSLKRIKELKASRDCLILDDKVKNYITRMNRVKVLEKAIKFHQNKLLKLQREAMQK